MTRRRRPQPQLKFPQLNRAEQRNRRRCLSPCRSPFRQQPAHRRLSLDHERLVVVAAAEVVADLVSGRLRLRPYQKHPLRSQWLKGIRLRLRSLRLCPNKPCRLLRLCRTRLWQRRLRQREPPRLLPVRARER